MSVRRLCELHGVNRSWFYEQQGREEVDTDQALSQDIEAVVVEFNGYGYRRVTRELARRGHPVHHKRVLRVMRERRLLCPPKRRYRATTDSNHNDKRFSNLLREVVPAQPDQVWQADLTYVRVQQGFAYLACVLDGFTREVVGWSMPTFMDADLPLAALNNALAARCPAPGLLHPIRTSGQAPYGRSGVPRRVRSRRGCRSAQDGRAIGKLSVRGPLAVRRNHPEHVQDGQSL